MSEGRRERIMTLLRGSADGLGVAVLAEALHIHPNTVRFHLDFLIASGRVESSITPAAGPGRPATVYHATRTMDRNGPSNYRLLADMLTSHLAAASRDPIRAAVSVGRSWGPRLVEAPRRRGAGAPVTKTEQLNQVVGVLDRLGFQPEPHQGARTNEIRLRHCPFLDLVEEKQQIVCSLHLGLMQGVMTAAGGPVMAESLDPFVEPDLCVAHLVRREA